MVTALCVVGLLRLTHLAFGGDTTTQTVTFEVTAINELTVSGDPHTLSVSAATPGSAPSSATDSTTTYAITTNESNRKITGAINSDMPSGVTLSVTLAAPTGGSSAGKQALTSSATDLVTGISTVNESGKAITYELEATTAAGVVSSASKTVTLTVTAGS